MEELEPIITQESVPEEPAAAMPETAPEDPPAIQESLPEKPKKKTRRSKKWLWKLLRGAACLLLICAVAAGSCLVTARLTERYWQNRLDTMTAATDNKLQALHEELEALREAPAPTIDPATLEGLTPRQVYEANVRSVVAIAAYQDASGQTGGVGTGFIVSADGYIVTNQHVISEARKIVVTTSDEQEYPAVVVGSEANTDLAVLKIQAKNLQPVVLGSSEQVQIGDQVVAVGNALGQYYATMTVGFVSAKDRMVNTDGTAISMLQTDASINSGNSGGPLFNMQGQVVGITTAKYSGFSASGATVEGIGFAVPIDDVVRQIRDLVEFGYITGAYLGVTIRELAPEVAEAYSLPLGLRVESTVSGGSAHRAGILPGDIIVNFGGYETESFAHLTRALRKFNAGDTTTVTVFRAGRLLDLAITLDEKPQGGISVPMPEEGDFNEWYAFFESYFGG